MRRDVRWSTDGSAIDGLGARLDELINERFRRLSKGIAQLQDRTLIEPVAVEPPKPFDGQLAFADGANWSPDGTGESALYYYSDSRWYRLLDDTHLSLAPPDYHDDPHPQYWHKILDPAWAHMYFEDFANTKALTIGQVITQWTGNVVNDHQITSNPTTGTIVLDSSGLHSELGMYAISITGFVEGSANQNYVVSLYNNGTATAIRMPVIFAGTATSSSIAWSGIAAISANATLDLGLESASGGSLNIYNINWSMHRVSPIAGATGVDISGYPQPPVPIPDGWGSPGK